MAGISRTGRAQRRRCLPHGPLGGGEGRQGAASVRARCRADGGPERGLAAQPCAGAVQRRRCISRCTDRSAGGCADWRTFSTTRARAWGGLDAAEASPRRCAPWRSRERRWSGPRGPFDRTTLPLAAVGAAARSRRRAGPGWHRRRRPWARRGSALRTATDPRRRGGCRAGKRVARGGEPAGAPTPRGGGSPAATPCQPPCRPVRRLRHGLSVCSRPRPARQRSRAKDHGPAWQGRRAPWYAYLHTAGRDLSGPCGVHGARHAWRGKETS